ncbi:glycosyltransferase [Candidatus Saccharibacteria bacterium]|nr:glycosyltransferase [Candidatus Saccharibacteria bacterium]
MIRVLIASPIRRKANILQAFLEGLPRLDAKGLSIHYLFVDDNDDPASSQLLANFAKKHSTATILKSTELFAHRTALINNNNHLWSDDLIWRVAAIKDEIIARAVKEKYDYLLFLDSDMVLQPPTLKHLVSLKKDIVSEIFWTDWHHIGHATPSLWIEDENTIVKKSATKNQDKYFTRRELASFNAMLKVPGTYPVGGLGALTLISNHALKKGVRFAEIPNLSFNGEDRHFCVRATALGLELFVDTHYPAFHIFYEELLKTLPNFIKYGYREQDILLSGGDPTNPPLPLKTKIKNNLKIHYRNLRGFYYYTRRKMFAKKRRTTGDKLTLMMMVHNESGRYLEEVITAVKPLLKNAVILDNASTDDTIELVKKALKGTPHHIIKNQTNHFAKEYKSRSRLWRETIKTNPDWILALDADEVLERNALKVIPELLKNPDVDVYGFPLYDFWQPDFYRDDALWSAHKNFADVLIRYQPKFRYKYPRRNHHCARLPENAIKILPYCHYPLRIKHLGWLRDEDKKAKYDRYLKMDPEGKYGSIAQYQSILDEHPNLTKFEE